MAYVKVHLKEIIKYVLLLGLGIQVVLGLIGCMLWLGRSDGVFQSCKALVSLLICGIIGYVFLGLWNENVSGRLRVFATLGVLTSPNVLQGCMQETKSFGAFIVPVMVIGVCFLWRKIRGRNQKALLIVSACCAMVLCCSIGMDESALAPRVLNRICYPTLYEGVENVPGELLEEAGYVELRESLKSPEGIQTRLYPALLERYGSEKEADSVCYKLVRYGFSYSTKKVIGNIAWDFAGYHFPLLVSELQLKGMSYDAVTGTNYGRLQDALGDFAELYWEYCVVWNLLGTVAIILCRIVKKHRFIRERVLALGLLSLGAFCYTMQGAGIFDYTKLLLVQFLWIGYVLSCINEKGL